MKANRSYQLRTGQMKLPVRKIEPVKYVDSKEKMTNIPKEPIIGELYLYEGIDVICIESETDNIYKCTRCILYKNVVCDRILCLKSTRKDRTPIILHRHNA